MFFGWSLPEGAQSMAGPHFLCLSIRGIHVIMPLAFRDQDTRECIGFLIGRTQGEWSGKGGRERRRKPHGLVSRWLGLQQRLLPRVCGMGWFSAPVGIYLPKFSLRERVKLQFVLSRSRLRFQNIMKGLLESTALAVPVRYEIDSMLDSYFCLTSS